MKLVIIFSLLLLTAAHGEPTIINDTAPPSIELGLSLGVLVPNILPDFDQLLTAWGPTVSLALGNDRLELQASYGSAERIYLFLGELNYRYQMKMPFLKPYALFGLGYLKYGANNNDYNFITPIGGLGLQFSMAKDFSVSLATKLYLPVKTILSFGGQFSYAL